jgi:hypothetical protein
MMNDRGAEKKSLAGISGAARASERGIGFSRKDAKTPSWKIGTSKAKTRCLSKIVSYNLINSALAILLKELA